MTNYFRNFIPRYSEIVSPLTDLAKLNTKFHWSAECENAFKVLKQKFINPPLLAFPDENKEYILYTDGCGTGVGGYLAQPDEKGVLKPIAYYSRKLSETEKKYSSFEIEFLGVIKCTEFFREYLLGKHFILRVDCKALLYCLSRITPNYRIVKWTVHLGEYEFTPQHVKAKFNLMADFLSRCYENEDEDKENESATLVNQNLKEKFEKAVLPIESATEEALFHYSKIPDVKDLERIRQMQREDPALSPIFDYLEEKQAIHRNKKYEDFFLNKDKILYVRKEKREEEGRELLVVPHALKAEILFSVHNIALLHAGLEKTFIHIRKFYWWMSMYADVRNFVLSCIQCIKKKAYNPKNVSSFLPFRSPANRFEKIFLDLMGPFPESKPDKYRYIVSVEDQFSRFMTLHPIKTATSIEIIKALHHSWFSVFGLSDILVSDNAKNLTSTVFEESLKKLNIKHVRTSAYRPHANIIERAHRICNAQIAMVCEETEMWPEILPAICLSYNSTYHSAIKCSPSMAAFGFEVKMLSERYVERKPLEFFVTESPHEYLARVQQETFIKVKENLKRAHEKQCKYRDKKAKNINYQVGDEVFVHMPKLAREPAHKIKLCNDGPYIITRKNSEKTFTLQSVENPENTLKTHVDYLIPIKEKRKDYLVFPKESERESDSERSEGELNTSEGSDSEEQEEWWGGNTFNPPTQSKVLDHLPVQQNEERVDPEASNESRDFLAVEDPATLRERKNDRYELRNKISPPVRYPQSHTKPAGICEVDLATSTEIPKTVECVSVRDSSLQEQTGEFSGNIVKQKIEQNKASKSKFDFGAKIREDVAAKLSNMLFEKMLDEE